MTNISTAKDLGALIKQRRKEHGLTQYDLAGLSMTSESFISKVESGKGAVPVVCINEKESGPHSFSKIPSDGPVPSIWHGYGLRITILIALLGMLCPKIQKKN